MYEVVVHCYPQNEKEKAIVELNGRVCITSSRYTKTLKSAKEVAQYTRHDEGFFFLTVYKLVYDNTLQQYFRDLDGPRYRFDKDGWEKKVSR